MSELDYAILGIIGLSAVISVVRGFIREAFSLVTWVAAFVLAFYFSPMLEPLLVDYIDVPSLRLTAAFLGLFLIILILGGLLNYFVGRLIDKTGLSTTDRMLGIVFGLARGVLIVAILVLLAGLTPFPKDPWWKASTLIPRIQPVVIWMRDLMPPDLGQYFVFEEVRSQERPTP
jgi:Uncharacterized membrane protein, required for colicin V production